MSVELKKSIAHTYSFHFSIHRRLCHAYLLCKDAPAAPFVLSPPFFLAPLFLLTLRVSSFGAPPASEMRRLRRRKKNMDASEAPMRDPKHPVASVCIRFEFVAQNSPWMSTNSNVFADAAAAETATVARASAARDTEKGVLIGVRVDLVYMLLSFRTQALTIEIFGDVPALAVLGEMRALMRTQSTPVSNSRELVLRGTGL